MNLIQIYTPMADKQDSNAIQFYVQLRDALQRIKRNEINIILGDFNTKLGRIMAEEIVEKYNLDDRNDRGDMLIQFCLEKESSKTDTMIFRHADCIRRSRYEIIANT